MTCELKAKLRDRSKRELVAILATANRTKYIAPLVISVTFEVGKPEQIFESNGAESNAHRSAAF